MKHLFVCFFCFSYSVLLYANPFTIKEKNTDYSTINLHIGEIAIEKVDGFDVIISKSKGNTQNIGKPQLPTYTFNYSADYDKDYTVNLEVADYVIYENINLLPTQNFKKVNEEEVFIKNSEFYKSNTKSIIYRYS